MRWIMDVRLKTKLAGAFLVVLGILCFVGAFSLHRLAQVQAVGDEINTVWMPHMGRLTTLRSKVRQAEIYQLLGVAAKEASQVAEAERAFDDLDVNVRELAKQYAATVVEPEERQILARAGEAWQRYADGRTELRALVHAGKSDEALQLVLGAQRQRHAVAIAGYQAAYELNVRMSQSHVAEADAAYRASQLWIGAAVGAAIVLGIALWLSLAHLIAKPVAALMKVFSAAAKGDLTARAEVLGRDELGRTALAMNAFLDSLHDHMLQVAHASEHVETAGAELASGAELLATETQEQASSIEETAASLEQIAHAMNRSAEQAAEASGVATRSRDTADEGGMVVGKAVSAMAEINVASRKISEIIGVIDEIAFQTNLLALNAAVEAARAGDEGRGFAVVAAEVRALAQRSASAAKEIKALISDSMEKVEGGTRLVDTSGKTFQEIVSSVRQVTDLVGHIATASGTQAAGMDTVHRSVSLMDRVVKSTAAQTDDLSRTADLLIGQAHTLRAMVGQFRLHEPGAAAQARSPELAARRAPRPERAAPSLTPALAR